MCGNIDDCGLDACGHENCVDEVKGYTCDCGEDYELMWQGKWLSVRGQGMRIFLLEHGSVEPTW